MFNIGGGELIVILMIALIVLGPKRLPDAARQIGKTMGDLRRLSSSFQDEVRGALNTVTDNPDQIASRRNLLGTETSSPAPADTPTAEAHPPRRKPLVAAPDPGPVAPPAKGSRSAPLRAEPTKPKNGTAVDKPAAAKPPARRAKPS